MAVLTPTFYAEVHNQSVVVPIGTQGPLVKRVHCLVNPSDSGDTFTVTLANFGIVTFISASGFVHTTTNSVVVSEAPTTAVSAGVLTVTVGGSSVTNKKRWFTINGYTDVA